VIFGEISLSGALRPVGQAENRLKEAQKLGFTTAIAPEHTKAGVSGDFRMRKLPDLVTFVGEMFGAG
ncbi:MAG: DNA repair protein RadA, partial [Paracoccaceae bacterium]